MIFRFVIMFFVFSPFVKGRPLGCLNFYKEKISGIHTLPNITEAPLPPEMVKQIQSWRPISEAAVVPVRYESAWKDEKIGDGSGFVIGLEHFGDAVPVNLGEHIAAHFVAKIIKILYPKAILEEGVFSGVNQKNPRIAHSSYTQWSAKHPRKKLIFIGIRDLQEKLGHGDKVVLEMNKTKMANPGLSGILKNGFRQTLGIPDSHHVVSMYFKKPEGERDSEKAPSMDEVLQKLMSYSKTPNIVFASGGGGNTVGAHAVFKKALQKDFGVLKLSEWAERYDPRRKWIVVNDLRGYMPHLLNVSDLAIVSGPINIMEPLTAAVPTLFFNNHEVVTDYNKAAFDHMAMIAMATGGAWSMSSLSDLQQVLPLALKVSKPIVPPYILRGPENSDFAGITPVDILTSEIIRKIVEGAKNIEEIIENPPMNPNLHRSSFDPSLYF